MATLNRDRRVRAFRAADEFALETYRVSRTLNQRLHPGLIDEIRRAAVRSGGALVAASGSSSGGAVERRLLEQARTGLLEGRYYLNIARRIGQWVATVGCLGDWLGMGSQPRKGCISIE